MFDFLQLVGNENMKIYRRARTWVMLSILAALVLGISIIAKFVGGEDLNNWLMMNIESSILFSFITIFTVVVSADSVAGEFTSGTIKLLLIRPWSRSKILLSKYISLLLFAVVQAILLFVLTLLLNMLLFGNDSSAGVVSEVFGVQRDIPPLAYMMLYYMYQFISLIVVVTMAFMLSTVFRSGGLAIGLSLFMLLAGNTVAGILSFLKYEWVDYLLFLHLNLTKFISEVPPGEHSLGFSLGVLGGYYVVFIALTWYIFNKRDVAA
ncbi:ABC transporter permease [Paenibacillus sp. GCM10027626]|uniref:ABC transporter permease n=1 Tax=Paenibacillus sp. GCM10027626 TaxID=3273411 RepID=UPI00363B3C66